MYLQMSLFGQGPSMNSKDRTVEVCSTRLNSAAFVRKCTILDFFVKNSDRLCTFLTMLLKWLFTSQKPKLWILRVFNIGHIFYIHQKSTIQVENTFFNNPEIRTPGGWLGIFVEIWFQIKNSKIYISNVKVMK